MAPGHIRIRQRGWDYGVECANCGDEKWFYDHNYRQYASPRKDAEQFARNAQAQHRCDPKKVMARRERSA